MCLLHFEVIANIPPSMRKNNMLMSVMSEKEGSRESGKENLRVINFDD